MPMTSPITAHQKAGGSLFEQRTGHMAFENIVQFMVQYTGQLFGIFHTIPQAAKNDEMAAGRHQGVEDRQVDGMNLEPILILALNRQDDVDQVCNLCQAQQIVAMLLCCPSFSSLETGTQGAAILASVEMLQI